MVAAATGRVAAAMVEGDIGLKRDGIGIDNGCDVMGFLVGPARIQHDAVADPDIGRQGDGQSDCPRWIAVSSQKPGRSFSTAFARDCLRRRGPRLHRREAAHLY